MPAKFSDIHPESGTPSTLIPAPQRIDYVQHNGLFKLPDRLRYEGVEILTARLKGTLYEIWPPAIHSGPATATFRVERASDLEPQGYRLEIESRGILLEAGETTGFRHGIQTLRQWAGRACAADGPGWRACRIHDYPRLQRRGFMLDVSRCKVPTRASLEALAGRLEALKLNELQLYTEHTFAYREHAAIWEGWSPYDADDIRWLREICEARGIDLVPNQNSFGHLERWLGHPAYTHLAEHPGPFTNAFGTRYPHGATLKPNAESLAFLDGLYRELLPLFTSDRFNAGCDETWELGQGWSRPMVEARGKHAVYLDFVRRIHQRIRAYDRIPMFWADILCEAPELAHELPHPMIGLVWGYEANHPFPEQLGIFQRAGLPYYVVPGTSSWRSLGGRLRNALDNLKAAAAAAREFKAEGLLITDWGDNGHHQPWPVSLLPLCAGAGLAWNPDVDPEPGLEAWCDRHIFEDPAGKAARAFAAIGSVPEAFAYRPHNSSPVFTMLFGDGTALEALRESIAPGESAEARQRIEAARTVFAVHRMQAPDAAIVDAEFNLVADLMSAGLDRFEGRLEPGQLHRLKEHFRSTWLRRNREGGLAQSLAYFPAED